MRSNNVWPALVTATALLGASPAARAGGSCIPGFADGIFGKNGVTFSGNGTTNSYDSSLGYAASATNSNGNVCTDSAASGAVGLSGNATINGSVCVGVGGTAGSPTITKSGNAGYQSASVQPANVALPSVTIPTVGTNQGNVSKGTLAPNQTYGTVSCTSKTGITLNAGTYVMTSLAISANCTLNVATGPVVLYISSSLSISGNGVSNPSLVASNLQIFAGPDVTSVSLTGNTNAAFALYAPNAAVSISGNGDIYGAVVAATITDSGNGEIHYDKQLATSVGGGFTCTAAEVSRASPVVATIGSQSAVVQGTYAAASGTVTSISTVASVATFSFPYIKGHMRARLASSITTTASTYSSGTVLFDAGATGMIPTVKYTGCSSHNGTCRNVFTNLGTPPASGSTFHPAMVQLDDGNSAAIGAVIAPTSVVTGIGATQWKTIVEDVLAAPLGGVDRSTVAVIDASTYAGSATRPTIAYFGATDGMIHAVCASTGGSTPSQSNICPSLGTELWAFLPRVQLPLVRSNTARLDGSVHVVDAYGDFVNNPVTGSRSFRTILTFQTGFSTGSTPAAYAVDVTDPASPSLLWEYTTPTKPSALDFGTGLTLAVGPTLAGGIMTNMVVAETNNGGTGTAGMVTTSLQLETGTKLWQVGVQYPSPPRGVAADGPLSATAIPGGAVGVDLVGQGYFTDFVAGDLYGELWRLAATDGSNRTGSTPMFQFASNKHPIGVAPTLYSDGTHQYAVFTSGGYVDPLATTWTSGSQYLISIKLSTTSLVTDAASACGTCALAVKQALIAGDNGYAQALIVGTQLLAVSDSSNVNLSTYGTGGNTGHVTTVSLTGQGSPTTVVALGGASSLAHSGTTVFMSTGEQQQQLASASTATGPKVALSTTMSVSRSLFVRTE
ncbi:MAG TPA: hypothetical protein VGF94_22585 [Kofleriaceae bacterium]|jgi:hypothetical protein